MANLPETTGPTAEWAPDIYQIAPRDPVSDAIHNQPHAELAARTQWLHQQVTDFGTGDVIATIAAAHIDNMRRFLTLKLEERQ